MLQSDVSLIKTKTSKHIFENMTIFLNPPLLKPSIQRFVFQSSPFKGAILRLQIGASVQAFSVVWCGLAWFGVARRGSASHGVVRVWESTSLTRLSQDDAR